MKLIIGKMTDRQIGDDRILYFPLSFVLPAVIILIALVLLQIVPYGEHSLLISDGSLAANGLAFFTTPSKMGWATTSGRFCPGVGSVWGRFWPGL